MENGIFQKNELASHTLNHLDLFHLDRLCREQSLDDFAVKEILEEHLERKLECECQVIFDERELRKEILRRQFGVDFDSGEVGLVD